MADSADLIALELTQARLIKGAENQIQHCNSGSDALCYFSLKKITGVTSGAPDDHKTPGVAHRDLLGFRSMEQASSPTDPAVIQAKRALLNGLAELRMIDALDDATTLAALTSLPHR